MGMWEIVLLLGVFSISFLVAYVLISKVPQRLHTPLMSMTNAISAVTILGAMLLFSIETTAVEKVLGGLALALATFNVVGGIVITHRIVGMFKTKKQSR
jgi:H+-translocating NAD(P) transhydrogenase subunit alpha